MKKLIELNIALSGSELATEFCNLDEVEQATFFNAIAKDAQKWQHPFVMQMQSIASSGILTDDGRYIMQSIGKYATES